MKTFAIVIGFLMLTSCKFSGTYHSATGQRFDFNTAIVIPVEECKK